MAIAYCIGCGQIGRNGDVTTIVARKRKHVRRFVLLAESAVQDADTTIAGNKHFYLAGNAGKALNPPGERAQPGCVDLNRWIEDDQRIAKIAIAAKLP